MAENIKVTELKPHPENELIYGQLEDVSDLVMQIEAIGKIIDPLKIKDDYTIISGHRRWKAARELGYPTVPCEIVDFDSPQEELAALVLYNYKRIKTNEQKAREGMTLFKTLSVDAVKRRLDNLNQANPEMDDSSTSGKNLETQGLDDSEATQKPETGLTRDKVAEAVGIKSGRTFDRMKDVLDRVDELRKAEKVEDSALFLAVLNRSASAAYDLLKVDLSSLSDEVRADIKSGKIAPRSLMPKEVKGKDEKPKRIIPIRKAINNVQDLARQVSFLTDSITTIKDKTQKQKIYGMIQEQIEILQSLLPSREPSEFKEEHEL